MCGYNFIFADNLSCQLQPLIKQMNKNIEWRGPDSSDIYLDSDIPLAMGHVRLAIQDLSPSAGQPFLSEDGRFALVFNGEIYNHNQLKKKYLETLRSRTSSDTETLLNLLIKYGVSKTLDLIDGMFSFVFYDRKHCRIYAARDRFGEKPLYYGVNEGRFFITSDLNSVRGPNWTFDIDRQSVISFFRLSYIPSPFSIYKNVKKLKGGQYFEVNLREIDFESESTLERLNIIDYYKIAIPRQKEEKSPSYKASKCKLKELIEKSVQERTISDVPLGSFLSGGVDSSLISAVLQNQSNKKIDTFTLGFENKEVNESEYAKKISKHIGSRHNEYIIKEKHLLDTIPQLSEMYSEPFADSSQLPTFLISQFARTKVTVCLSGDAGDELFCGYNRYLYTAGLLAKFQKMPIWYKKSLSKIILSLPLSKMQIFYDYVRSNLPAKFNITMMANKLIKFANALAASSTSSFITESMSIYKNAGNLVLDERERATELDMVNESEIKCFGVENVLMNLDQKMYLPDDILTKVDRASMYASLEARVPLLSKDIVQFAHELPLDYKLNGIKGKYILRDVLYDYVPATLIERPKQGFAVPLKNWLTNELRDWCESMLSTTNLNKSGILNVSEIRRLWESHLKGKESNEYVLWNILMFQSWYLKREL